MVAGTHDAQSAVKERYDAGREDGVAFRSAAMLAEALGNVQESVLEVVI
mgnify:CR=1 FL=1